MAALALQFIEPDFYRALSTGPAEPRMNSLPVMRSQISSFALGVVTEAVRLRQADPSMTKC